MYAYAGLHKLSPCPKCRMGKIVICISLYTRREGVYSTETDMLMGARGVSFFYNLQRTSVNIAVLKRVLCDGTSAAVSTVYSPSYR